jgi:hypothetical protein
MTITPRRNPLGYYPDRSFFAADQGPNLSCFAGPLWGQALILSEKNRKFRKYPIKPGSVFVDLYI